MVRAQNGQNMSDEVKKSKSDGTSVCRENKTNGSDFWFQQKGTDHAVLYISKKYVNDYLGKTT